MTTPIKATSKAHILADIAFKPHSEGGRAMMPIDNGYAPYLRSNLTSKDLAVRINNIPKGAQFNKTIRVIIELSYFPKLDYGDLTDGTPIQLIEGPKIVAEGTCKSSIMLS